MDFSLNEEQQAVRDLALQIFSDRTAAEQLRELEKNDDGLGPFDPILWSALAEAGLIGIGIPETYGGAGLDFVSVAQVIEIAGLTAAYVPVLETMVGAADTIANFGTEEQKALWLPRLAAGDLIATAATAEIVGDLITRGITQPATQAKESGGGYIITGVKACVPAGLRAELFLIPTTLPNGEVGVFLVDASQVITERQDAAFQPEAIVILNEVVVGGDRLLGGAQADGDTVASTMALHLRAALCTLEAGAATAAVRLGAEYTSEREQFDKKIATFQAVGQRMADAYVDAEAIRLTALQAAWRISQGLDAVDQTAIAKYWAAEGGQRVVHAATHVHGGVGVDRDYPLHRFFLLTRQIELTLGGATENLLALGASAASSS